MNNTNNFNNIIINNDNNFININYINDIKNNDRIGININNNTHNTQNNNTFKVISNLRDNRFQNEDKYERHTYVPKNNINIFNNNNEPINNKYERNITMMRGKQIKIMHKNKSYGKESHKKHKKKTGIIEQIKKEQSEKKNNNMFSTFNNRNKNIIMVNSGTPYSNSKTQAYSKNSIAKIDYNNVYQNDPSFINMINDNINNNINDNNYYHHNKTKSVNFSKCLSCSPKKKYEDFSKYKFNQPEKNNFYIYDNNNINNNNFIINKTNNYNEEDFQKIINMNKIRQVQENNSFILLRQKYLEFLLKTYGNNNIPFNKENEELDNIFLKGLVKNEVPIENININVLKCSKDMKNFICESLENFKLQQ